MNEVVAPFNPNCGTERNREIIRFFKPNKNDSRIIKFLCSAKIICLNAIEGSSMIFRMVSHRSRFTTLSLRKDLHSSQICL